MREIEMIRRMGLVIEVPEFDPKKHVRFRGKPIEALTREELVDALEQALREIHAARSRS